MRNHWKTQEREIVMSKKTSKEKTPKFSELENHSAAEETQEIVEELRGLTLCLQHLSKEALGYDCFSAASHLILAARDINQAILERQKLSLLEGLGCNELILDKIVAKESTA